MVEKAQESERAVAAEEPAEIKACVGATGGGDGASAAVEVPTPKGDGSAIPPAELERLRNDLIAALKTVFDPEIPVDVYELGLIYRLDIDDDRNIEVDMTLTAPGCPVAGEMPDMVKAALEGVEGIGAVTVNMVFDPPWAPYRMSEEARLELNMF